MAKGKVKAKRTEAGEDLILELLRDADKLALSANQKGQLRYAQLLRGPNSTRKDRMRADQVVANVQRALLAGMEETMRIERAKGGEVVDFNDAGAKRMTSRDGILNLLKAKKLTAEQATAALAYRLAREAVGMMPSQLGRDGVGGGQVDHVGLGLKRAKLGVAAAQVDRDVALQLRHRPEAGEVLRRVAGDGYCLRALAPGGKQFERLLESLRMALDIAARRVKELDPSNEGA